MVSSMSINIMANESGLQQTDKIKERIESGVIIKDRITGEIKQYKISNENIELSVSPDGKEITAVAYVRNNHQIQQYDQSQANSNTIYGWEGNARITFEIDDRYARLTSAGGDWTRVSGNYDMTNKMLSYGQRLGTNSRSGQMSFINSCNVSLMWPAGLYGYDLMQYLASTVSGYINGEEVVVYCIYYI